MREAQPSSEEVRARIENVEREEIRLCLQTAYLYAGRISEVVGNASPGDTTVARGPKTEDLRFDSVDGHETALFTVRTAKREGLERIVALPLDYEPWAQTITDYFKRAGGTVFPFTRQYVSTYITEHCTFEELQYPIDKYKKARESVPRHWRSFKLHALRHIRATELIQFYHFEPKDLAAYCGWKLRTVNSGISSVMERYIDLQWQGYYHKLLRPRESARL